MFIRGFCNVHTYYDVQISIMWLACSYFFLYISIPVIMCFFFQMYKKVVIPCVFKKDICKSSCLSDVYKKIIIFNSVHQMFKKSLHCYGLSDVYRNHCFYSSYCHHLVSFVLVLCHPLPGEKIESCDPLRLVTINQLVEGVRRETDRLTKNEACFLYQRKQGDRDRNEEKIDRRNTQKRTKMYKKQKKELEEKE